MRKMRTERMEKET